MPSTITWHLHECHACATPRPRAPQRCIATWTRVRPDSNDPVSHVRTRRPGWPQIWSKYWVSQGIQGIFVYTRRFMSLIQKFCSPRPGYAGTGKGAHADAAAHLDLGCPRSARAPGSSTGVPGCRHVISFQLLPGSTPVATPTTFKNGLSNAQSMRWYVSQFC